MHLRRRTIFGPLPIVMVLLLALVAGTPAAPRTAAATWGSGPSTVQPIAP